MRKILISVMLLSLASTGSYALEGNVSTERLYDSRGSWVLTAPPSIILWTVYAKHSKRKNAPKKSSMTLSEAALEHVRHLPMDNEKKQSTLKLVHESYEKHDVPLHKETLHKVASTPYVRAEPDFMKKEHPKNFKHQHEYFDLIREADLLAHEGEKEKACKIYEDCLEMPSQLRSTDGMLLVRLVDRLTRIYYLEGNYRKAEEIIRHHLARHDSMFERLGPDDPELLEIAFLLQDLGLVYGGMHRNHEAEACTLEALEIVKKFNGEKSADYIVMLGGLARLHKHMGHLEQAEKEYTRAINLASESKVLSDNSQAIILGNYYKLLEKMGKSRKAEKIAAQANELKPGTIH